MKVKKIIKSLTNAKYKIALLTMITPLTLSACSFISDKVLTDEQTTKLAEIIDTTVDISKNTAGTVDKLRAAAEFQKASIVRVVDGDTIVVNIDREEFTVRMIGVDTPESVATDEYLKKSGKENTVEGKLASEYTNGLLKDLGYVYLQKDVSNTDQYGRLLRYVWTEIPENDLDLEEISTKMVNGILIAQGYANPVVFYPDTKHAMDFQELSEMN